MNSSMYCALASASFAALSGLKNFLEQNQQALRQGMSNAGQATAEFLFNQALGSYLEGNENAEENALQVFCLTFLVSSRQVFQAGASNVGNLFGGGLFDLVYLAVSYSHSAVEVLLEDNQANLTELTLFNNTTQNDGFVEVYEASNAALLEGNQASVAGLSFFNNSTQHDGLVEVYTVNNSTAYTAY